jgi:hypothetical protein
MDLSWLASAGADRHSGEPWRLFRPERYPDAPVGGASDLLTWNASAAAIRNVRFTSIVLKLA